VACGNQVEKTKKTSTVSNKETSAKKDDKVSVAEETSVKEDDKVSETEETGLTQGEEEDFIEGYTIYATEESSIQIQYPLDWKANDTYTDQYSALYSFKAPNKPREKAAPHIDIY